MHLRGCRGKCGLGILVVLVQFVLGQGDEDFQEFLFCPTNSNDRVLECPEGKVIDVQQARVASLEAMGLPTNPCSDLSSKSAVTNRYHLQCKRELNLLSCHGKQRCTVNRTMAQVWLPECQGDRWDDPRGRFSDVLYVNYTCQERGVQEFQICHTDSLNRELECPEGKVIDIQQARAASLEAMGLPTNPCSDLSSKFAITDRYFQQCKRDLKHLSCHGKQSCIVNRTMAQVWLPECLGDHWDDPPGRYSDVLYVSYTCYKLAAMTLPPLSDVTSHTFDVISPGFPDVNNEGQYNVTCTIIPSKETNEDITVQVEIKLVMIESPLQGINSACLDSLLVSLSGDVFFCYQEIPVRISNDNWGTRTGRNFTLEYRSDGTVKHKFWIQFTATTVDSGDGVNITVSCTDNLPTTTTTATTITAETFTTAAVARTESTEKSQNDGVIIGSVLGVLLLMVLVALIGVIVMYRKVIKRKDEAAAAPSGDVYSDTTSGQLNNGGNTSGYINVSGPQKPCENFSSTYTSILEDNDANTTADRGPINDEPGDYDYIKVVDNRNHSNNVVGTNGGTKYEDLLTATRDTKKTEPYEELSIVAK